MNEDIIGSGNLAQIIVSELIVYSPTMADADAVADLINACSEAEGGTTIMTAEVLRSEWQTPGFDPATDAWIVAVPLWDGKCVIAGYVEVWDDVWVGEQRTHIHAQAWGCVHLDYRGQGIGTQLARLARDRVKQTVKKAPPGARAVLRNEINSADQAARRLLDLEGYSPLLHVGRMMIEMDISPAAPQWSSRISVWRHVFGQDDYMVYEAMQDAVRDHADHASVPFEHWLHQITHSCQFDSPCWLLAVDGPDIAGGVLCRPEVFADPDLGWISQLFVRPAWRGLGLGMALLQHACGNFFQRGTRRLGLVIDTRNLDDGLGLERVGLRVARQYTTYEKALH